MATHDSDILKLIQNQHAYLCAQRDEGKRTDRRVHEDIAVYEFILKHDDPERAAKTYFETISRARDKLKTYDVPKIEVARRLGWEIAV